VADLTDKQIAFLDALYGEAEGDIRKAMDIAGYSKNTPESVVINALADEIIDRSKRVIAANTARATLKMIGVIKDPTSLGAEKALNAAKELLDRAGIVKKDKVEVSGDGSVGLFILPPKKQD